MVSDPKRLVQRYYNDLTGFTTFFVSQWFHMKTRRGDSTSNKQSKVVLEKNKATVSLSGRVDMANNRVLSELLESALHQTQHIELNLEHVTFLDSVAIGTILACTRIARDRQGDINLINVPRQLMKTLNLLKLDHFFELTELSQKTNVQLNKSVEITEKTITIPIPSVFDATASQPVIEQAFSLIEPGKNLILDFSDTRLLTSAGLAAIVRINREIQKHDGTVKLSNCSDDVRRILKLVRFDAIFPII